MDLGREVLRRDRLYRELPEAVRKAGREHDLQRLDPQLVERVNREFWGRDYSRATTNPLGYFNSAVRGLRQVSEALRQHAPPQDQPQRHGRTWSEVVRYAGVRPGGTLPGSGAGPRPPARPPAPAPEPAPVPAAPAGNPLHDPIPVAQLHAAAIRPWTGPGLSDLQVLSYGGRRYFAKKPLRHDGTGALAGDDLAVELAAHRILRLAGIPGVAPAELLDRGEDDRRIVTPELFGDNFNDVVLRMTGKSRRLHDYDDWYRAASSRPVANEMKRLVRSVPPEQLGTIAWGNWLVNAGDRHANNYLFNEGHVHPIDYGYSVWPLDGLREMHWHANDALFGEGKFTPREFAKLPVSRAAVERTLATKEPVMAQLHDLAGYYPFRGYYDGTKMLQHFEKKFASIARVLKRRKGALTLGDFGIMGQLPSPAR